MIDYRQLQTSRVLTHQLFKEIYALANNLCQLLDENDPLLSVQLSLAEKHRDLIRKTYQTIRKQTVPPAGSDDESQLRYQRNVLQQIQELQRAGQWQSRVVWQAVEYKLNQLKDVLQSSMQAIGSQPVKKQTVSDKPQTISNAELDTTIYIHLYQATGKQLSSWIPQLQNLQHLAQSRPVYATQEAIMTVLAERSNVATDAYVGIKLTKDALVQTFRGRAQTDKYGQALVTLDMDLWPDLPRIAHFYHQGKYYRWTGETLVLV